MLFVSGNLQNGEDLYNSIRYRAKQSERSPLNWLLTYRSSIQRISISRCTVCLDTFMLTSHHTGLLKTTHTVNTLQNTTWSFDEQQSALVAETTSQQQAAIDQKTPVPSNNYVYQILELEIRADHRLNFATCCWFFWFRVARSYTIAFGLCTPRSLNPLNSSAPFSTGIALRERCSTGLFSALRSLTH